VNASGKDLVERGVLHEPTAILLPHAPSVNAKPAAFLSTAGQADAKTGFGRAKKILCTGYSDARVFSVEKLSENPSARWAEAALTPSV
jgi:hypothetical protein